MNRRERRYFIGLEALEGRKVLSTVAGMTAPLKGALTDGITYVDLQGSARGTPSTVVGNPDVGTTVDFRGTGTVQGVGSATLTGSLHGTGFVKSSHVEGTITLTNSQGSITLKLQSPKSGGFTAPGSGSYSFSVSKGTGTFKHDFGSGTVELALNSRSFSMTFLGKPDVY